MENQDDLEDSGPPPRSKLIHPALLIEDAELSKHSSPLTTLLVRCLTLGEHYGLVDAEDALDLLFDLRHHRRVVRTHLL